MGLPRNGAAHRASDASFKKWDWGDFLPEIAILGCTAAFVASTGGDAVRKPPEVLVLLINQRFPGLRFVWVDFPSTRGPQKEKHHAGAVAARTGAN